MEVAQSAARKLPTVTRAQLFSIRSSRVFAQHGNQKLLARLGRFEGLFFGVGRNGASAFTNWQNYG